MKNIKIKIIVSFIMTFFTLSLFLPAFAQVIDVLETDSDIKGLIVSPSIIEEVVKPGQDSKIELEINNPSHISLPIKSYIREFNASDETGGVEFEEDPDSDRLSIPNWGKIINPDFVLQPNAKRQIEILLSTPNDLPPGGYYGTIFFEILVPEKFYDASSLEIGGRVGALLFLISEGDIVQKGKISELKITDNIATRDQAKLELKFSNSGNVHLRPKGKVEIKNLITGLTKEFNIGEYTVLPQKTRKINAPINDIYWPGIYQLKVIQQYGRDKNISMAQINFCYLQLYHLLAILLIVLIVTIFMLPKLRKNFISAVRIIICGA